MKRLFSILMGEGQVSRWFVSLMITVCFAAAAIPGDVWALDATPLSVSDFQRTTFTVKDGAPERTWVMAQTTDGWIWFAGSTNLTRFDGVEFEKVEVATDDGRLSAGVSALYALSSGGLLIGHLSGGVSIYRHGAFTRFDSEELRAAGRSHMFAAGPDGSIWGAFESGLMRFDGTAWTRVGQKWNFPSGPVQGVVFDGGGTLWVHMPKNVLRLRQGSNSFERVAEVDEPGDLVRSPDGDLLFIGILGNSIPTRRWPGGGPAPIGATVRQTTEMLFDSSGHLWSGLVADSSDPEVTRSRVAGLSEFGVISDIFEDLDGNIWIAQLGKVHRLRSSPIVRIIDTRNADGKVDFAWVNLASDDKGTIWFTRGSAATVVDDSMRATLWSVKDGARPAKVDGVGYIERIASETSGTLWAAGVSGLYEGRGDTGFTKRADFSTALWGANIAPGCAGGLWTAIPRLGLRRYSQGAWQDWGNLKTLPAGIPTAMHCDKERNLWLGYGDGRIFKVDETLSPSAAYHFNGPGIGAISSFSIGRHTLVGGSSGLAVLGKEGFSRASSRLPVLEGVTGIAESPDGTVWINGVRGLVRLWDSDLESEAQRIAGVRTQLFDADDGFPGAAYSLSMPMSSLAVGGDRRVWFSGLNGLAFVDTTRLSSASPPPQIVFKALMAGEETVEATDATTLPQGTRSLEISYTALRSIHADRLRFRYRLDGVDDDWVNVGERRRAIYTNLPPGQHQFQLDVSDELGSWSTHPSTLTFEIPPTFLQSRTFKALCLTTMLALLAFAYRLRVRQLEMQHQRLLSERLNERERIARELHDTLLQGTQALIMKVHSATKLVGKDEPIHNALDKALDQATGVLVEARNRIEDLRVRSGPREDDLPTLLVRLGHELMQGGSPRFEAVVEGASRELAHNVLQEAGLIGREALSNAFHHSKATTIELQIEFGDQHLRMRIRDDGCGFDDGSLARPPGGRHWGLPGMKERARAISSELTIWSRPGMGTEIELQVPGRVAYLTAAAPRRWRTFRGALGYPK